MAERVHIPVLWFPHSLHYKLANVVYRAGAQHSILPKILGRNYGFWSQITYNFWESTAYPGFMSNDTVVDPFSCHHYIVSCFTLTLARMSNLSKTIALA
jgi:hypothetical protein